MDYIKVYKDISSRTMTKQNAMQRLSLTDKRFFLIIRTNLRILFINKLN